MSNENNPPPPPKEVGMNGIVNPQGKPSFTTSAEIRLDQSMQMFLKGKRAYDSGDLDNAITSLKSAVENLRNSDLGSDASTFYSYLGLSYAKKGWQGYAKAQFQQALALNPKDTIALENINKTSVDPTPTKAVDKSDTKIVEERGLIKKIKSIFVKK